MTNRERAQAKKARDKIEHEIAGTVGRKHGIVGNDIPDEGKERHTEIAVEVGEKVVHEQQRPKR